MKLSGTKVTFCKGIKHFSTLANSAFVLLSLLNVKTVEEIFICTLAGLCNNNSAHYFHASLPLSNKDTSALEYDTLG